MNKQHPDYAVHSTHCFQNEYTQSCKYMDEDCPYTPETFPYTTYDENQNKVKVYENGDEVQVD